MDSEEPEIKKQKLNMTAEKITNMKNSENNLKSILNDNLLEECAKCKFYIGKIKNKKLIYRVIVELNNIMPLDRHPHLKRAKSIDILLCPSEDLSIDQLKEKFIAYNFDYNTLLVDDITEGYVPGSPPLVKWQFDLANKIWPCNFHPNKHLERMVSDSYFEQNDIIRHRTYMAIAYEVGLISTKDRSEDISLKDIKGVVVVDPEIDSIVAIGYDNSEENPCMHQVMIAIDNVAKSQNGGAWKSDDIDTGSDDNTGKGTPENFAAALVEKFGALTKFGARPTIRRGESRESETEPSGPYLCTNYDVYTTIEPCLMCAMALVHSRAKKVFFAWPNCTKGALGSKCKLHTAAGLNHHYEVFTGFF